MDTASRKRLAVIYERIAALRVEYAQAAAAAKPVIEAAYETEVKNLPRNTQPYVTGLVAGDVVR